jgi:hypothetical protein
MTPDPSYLMSQWETLYVSVVFLAGLFLLFR